MATALRRVQETMGASHAPGGPDSDVMSDPLHPMHQHLLAQFSASASAAPVMTRPPFMAFAFYAGIAAWGAVWFAVNLAVEWF